MFKGDIVIYVDTLTKHDYEDQSLQEILKDSTRCTEHCNKCCCLLQSYFIKPYLI